MSNGPYTVTETPNICITLPDGTKLAARMWRPDTDQLVPAILEYLPYRKRDGTNARDALTHPWFAAQGYACLRVDIRGNGDSDGIMTDEYTQTELDDAVDVINWIADQGWCSGAVGMMGISWGGFNALQVAAMAPEPLKAIVTLCSTVDRYADDIHYKGGAMLCENLGWSATMLSYSSRAPDPAVVGPRWREMWLERLEAEPHLAEIWSQHQHRDDYWKHGSVCEDYSAIKAATLAVGGWGDAYKNAVPAIVKNLEAPAKGIIGPWIHKYPHFAVPEPRIGFLQEATRWWDRWLKGEETGVENDPDLRLYVMDGLPPKPWYEERPGRWIAQNAGSAQALNLDLGDGSLGAAGSFETIVNSPADTGIAAGEYCAIWLGPELPGDQRRDDALSACFDGDVLEAPVSIVGAPQVTLTLHSDKPVAQIAVRLCDVAPDGASSRITYGILNLTHRNSHESPEALPTGTPINVSLDLDQSAYRVPAGHRIRLAVSTVYWPLIWPSPERTTLTLTSGTVSLPLENNTGEAVTFEPPQSAEPWRTETLRDPSSKRDTCLDAQTGETRLEIVDDFGEVRDLDHGLCAGSIAREIWATHPDDPLCARGETHWTDTITRDDIRLRTETKSRMTADATHFHLTARVEAYENDALIFEKDFDTKVPRDLV